MRRSALFLSALSDRSRRGLARPTAEDTPRWAFDWGRAGRCCYAHPATQHLTPRRATAPPPITPTCTSSVHRVNGERGVRIRPLQGTGISFLRIVARDCGG